MTVTLSHKFYDTMGTPLHDRILKCVMEWHRRVTSRPGRYKALLNQTMSSSDNQKSVTGAPEVWRGDAASRSLFREPRLKL